MREKIADIYERLVQRNKEIDEDFLNKLYPDAKDFIGKKLYVCRSSFRNPSNELEEWIITDVSIIQKNTRNGYIFMPHSKKITKKFIESVEAYIEMYENLPLDTFDVFFSIERSDKYGKTSSGLRYVVGSGFTDKNVSLDPKDFDEKIKADKEEYEKYYKPREGCVACERCGKQVPIENVVKYKLIYQSWDSRYGRRVVNRIGQFCSGDCALNEQMSLEG